MSNNTVSTNAALQRWRRALGSAVLLYPLAMHVFIVYELQAVALLGLAAISIAAAVFAWLDSGGRIQALPYLFIAAAAGTGLASGGEFALYLPSIVFNLVFAGVFGRTLRTGDIPMVERFMRVHHGENLVPELVRYARQLTVTWTVFCTVMALTSAVLMIFTSLETWSLFANVVNYVLIAALFIGQFVYGYVRYRAIAPMQIMPTAARVARRVTAGSSGRR
jgi:uncharacterized membrane protein